MALKFRCGNCEKEIVVKYLMKGETAKCRHCGAETVVPDDALETGAPPTITEVLERRKEERVERREQTNPFPLVPFCSGHFRARIAILVVVVGILLVPISVEYTYSQIKLLGEAMVEGGATWEQAETYLERQTAIMALKVITFIPMLVFLLMWIHRAYRNLPSLGVTGLRFKPRKAVSCWFTPFINFYRPFQVIKEIWKASDPDVDISDSSSWQNAGSWSAIGWWWFLFLTSHSMWYSSMRRVAETKVLSKLLTLHWVAMISHFLYVVAAMLLILIVRRIDARQEEKHRRVTRHTMRLSGLSSK